jgi:hypothetical protein
VNITLNPFGHWRRIATVEVSSRVRDLPALVQDDTLTFRLVEASSPRRSFRRYDLVVDSTTGERRCARTAWTVLTAMQHAADIGCIDQYRVIEGNQWLSMFDQPPATSAGNLHAAGAA